METNSERLLCAALDRQNVSYIQHQFILGYEIDIELPGGVLDEVDGLVHITVRAQIRDALKTKALEALGYKVIRMNNSQVHNDSRGCAKMLEQHIDPEGSFWPPVTHEEPLAGWQIALRKYLRVLLDEEIVETGCEEHFAKMPFVRDVAQLEVMALASSRIDGGRGSLRAIAG